MRGKRYHAKRRPPRSRGLANVRSLSCERLHARGGSAARRLPPRSCTQRWAICNRRDAALVWVGRGASAPGRHQAACQLQRKVSPPREITFIFCSQAADPPLLHARRPRPRVGTVLYTSRSISAARRRGICSAAAANKEDASRQCAGEPSNRTGDACALIDFTTPEVVR
jgi:hypothetical protein